MTVVRIVNAPVSGATTLLDLSPGTAGLQLGEGFDAPPPPLTRSLSNNALMDGGVQSGAVFGLRQVTLPLAYPTQIGQPIANREAAITTLVRLLEQGGWLEVTSQGSTAPRYLRFLPSAEAAVIAKLTLQLNAQVVLSLLCDPFAYGQRVTFSAGHTFTTDPTTATSGNTGGPLYDYGSSILGDVDTPLLLWSQSSLQNIAQMHLLSMSHASALTTPGLTLQAENPASVLSTGDTSSVAVAGTSGGSVLRCTFSMLTQSSPRAQYSKTLPNPGSYRVFAVYRKTVASDVNTLYMSAASAASAPYPTVGNVLTLPAVGLANTPYIADLGLFQTPIGGGIGKPGLSSKALNGPTVITLYEGRTSGSGSLDIDYLLFVPADDTILTATVNALSTANFVAYDGITEQVWQFDGGDPFDPSTFASQYIGASIALSGGFPMLRPGAPNVLMFLGPFDIGTGLDGSSGGLTLTNTTAFSAGYWPRYLSAIA